MQSTAQAQAADSKKQLANATAHGTRLLLLRRWEYILLCACLSLIRCVLRNCQADLQLHWLLHQTTLGVQVGHRLVGSHQSRWDGKSRRPSRSSKLSLRQRNPHPCPPIGSPRGQTRTLATSSQAARPHVCTRRRVAKVASCLDDRNRLHSFFGSSTFFVGLPEGGCIDPILFPKKQMQRVELYQFSHKYNP